MLSAGGPATTTTTSQNLAAKTAAPRLFEGGTAAAQQPADASRLVSRTELRSADYSSWRPGAAPVRYEAGDRRLSPRPGHVGYAPAISARSQGELRPENAGPADRRSRRAHNAEQDGDGDDGDRLAGGDTSAPVSPIERHQPRAGWSSSGLKGYATDECGDERRIRPRVTSPAFAHDHRLVQALGTVFEHSGFSFLLIVRRSSRGETVARK
jgi:hypothetical protein